MRFEKRKGDTGQKKSHTPQGIWETDESINPSSLSQRSITGRSLAIRKFL